MGFETLDLSHLVASSPIAGVLYYVVVRVIKPLVENYLESMTNAIKENTATVKELVEKQDRASEHQHAEHAEMVALLRILTDSLLRMNGGDLHAVDKVREPPSTETETTEQRLLRIEKALGGL